MMTPLATAIAVLAIVSVPSAQALAAGDGQRSAGAFKNALNRYKDAFAKAGSA